MSKQFNRPIITSKFENELKQKKQQFDLLDFPKKDCIETTTDVEIRLFLDRYSNFREFEQSETISSLTSFRSSFHLLNRGVDLLEDTTMHAYKKLLIGYCDVNEISEFGIGGILYSDKTRKSAIFNANTMQLENAKNIEQVDVERVKLMIHTNLYCFANFHENLLHVTTYRDGLSNKPISELLTDSNGQLTFVKGDIHLKVKLNDTILTREILENVRAQVKAVLRENFRPKITKAIKLLKKAMRRFHKRKSLQVEKIQKYIRKETIMCLPKLATFLKWKMVWQHNKILKQTRAEKLKTTLSLTPEERTNVRDITIAKLDMLIDSSKKQYETELLNQYEKSTRLKPLKELMLYHLAEGTLYNWSNEQKSTFRKNIHRDLIRRHEAMQHKLNLKIASIRSGFISNKKFLEREKWFGFNRNKQLGNMLLQNQLDPNILEIDWNDCVIEENSRKIKLALSKLCRLTKTKQYIAFCNTSYCVKFSPNEEAKLSPLKKMFCTILGFNNYTYQEFATLIINHMEFVSKNRKGVNWITKYLGNVYDQYIEFLTTLKDKEKCLRWCDISQTKLCLDDVENKNQTFIKITGKINTKEEVVAKSFNAGVFKYIKDAIKLIKNRSKVMVKRWKDFCDENDIEDEEIQLLNEATIYDKLSVELARENHLYNNMADY
jgi:hypothetical protein